MVLRSGDFKNVKQLIYTTLLSQVMGQRGPKHVTVEVLLEPYCISEQTRVCSC